MSQSTARLRTLYPFLLHHHHRTIMTMVRSAIRATRFTPISPYATSKLTSVHSSTFSPSNSFPSHSLPRQRTINPNTSNSPPPPFPPPPNAPSSETPAQKVARLRAARRAAKNVPIPLWDRIVVSGRWWADVIHRTTVVLIIGFSSIVFPLTLPLPYISLSPHCMRK